MPAPSLPLALAAGTAALLLALGCASSTARPPTEDDSVKRSAPAKAPKPASAISFKQEEPWYSFDMTLRGSLDFDQPVTQVESPSGYRPRATYDGPKDWSKLVIDLVCSWDDRAPDEAASGKEGPLASLATVYVFGEDRSAPLAVFARADLTLERGTANGFEMDGRGPIISTVERFRMPFAAHRALVRDGHPYRLTLVAVDGEGRTMICDDLEGDEAGSAIEPLPLPQTGWAAPLGGQPAKRSAEASQPNAAERAPVDTGTLMEHLPQAITGWKLVAAYPMLKSDPAIDDSSAVHAHYRQGNHVVVLSILDGGGMAAQFAPHFEAQPPAVTDDAGTVTTFRPDGAGWLMEQVYRAPYEREKVVPYFSYNMRMVNEAQPQTPGAATMISATLPNGIMVSARAPQDVDAAMVRQVFDALDRERLAAITAGHP